MSETLIERRADHRQQLVASRVAPPDLGLPAARTAIRLSRHGGSRQHEGGEFRGARNLPWEWAHRSSAPCEREACRGGCGLMTVDQARRPLPPIASAAIERRLGAPHAEARGQWRPT